MTQFIFKTKPFKHQLEALKISCDLEEFGLFLEMGTGKSKIIIDGIWEAYNKGVSNEKDIK